MVRVLLQVTTDAEKRKAAKYSSLSSDYIFVPIAIDRFDAIGLEASAYFSDLGRRLHFAAHYHVPTGF